MLTYDILAAVPGFRLGVQWSKKKKPVPTREATLQVPFNDLGRQVGARRTQIEAAIAAVLDSGWFVGGPQLRAFESEFADYCGAAHCIGVGNGTDALEIALRSIGCGQGDEVITVANAGMYCTSACLIIGAVPVFADVDPATLNIDPSGIEGLLSPRTKAIVVTHLYGKLADVDSVLRIARAAGVAVIEDCAHAHGASRDGRLAGSLADVAAFSFYPTKNLGGLGDGGAVVTNDGAIAEKVRCLHQYGWSERYCAAMPRGRNSRLDAVQAAVLRVKLPQLDVRNERCRDIVGAYREAARGTGLQVLHEPGSDFVAHLCVGLHEDRDALRARLADCGVETAIHYPVPDHRQPALACVPWRVKSLEVTDQASRNIFSLPCFSELTDTEVEYICRQISQHA